MNWQKLRSAARATFRNINLEMNCELYPNIKQIANFNKTRQY